MTFNKSFVLVLSSLRLLLLGLSHPSSCTRKRDLSSWCGPHLACYNNSETRMWVSGLQTMASHWHARCRLDSTRDSLAWPSLPELQHVLSHHSGETASAVSILGFVSGLKRQAERCNWVKKVYFKSSWQGRGKTGNGSGLRLDSEITSR